MLKQPPKFFEPFKKTKNLFRIRLWKTKRGWGRRGPLTLLTPGHAPFAHGFKIAMGKPWIAKKKRNGTKCAPAINFEIDSEKGCPCLHHNQTEVWRWGRPRLYWKMSNVLGGGGRGDFHAPRFFCETVRKIHFPKEQKKCAGKTHFYQDVVVYPGSLFVTSGSDSVPDGTAPPGVCSCGREAAHPGEGGMSPAQRPPPTPNTGSLTFGPGLMTDD